MSSFLLFPVSKGYESPKSTLMGKESNVSWLIKTGEEKFEIWTDQEYTMRKQKCEYYGSKPAWVEIRKMDSSLSHNAYQKPAASQIEQLMLDLSLSR